jgi:hypothetical protein
VILERESIRTLRALRFFDWAEPHEVSDACGANDKRASDCLRQVLLRLTRAGLVERRVCLAFVRHGALVTTGRFEYRVTELGRRELARAIKRAANRFELQPCL